MLAHEEDVVSLTETVGPHHEDDVINRQDELVLDRKRDDVTNDVSPTVIKDQVTNEDNRTPSPSLAFRSRANVS